ncbi:MULTISPECIES: hypothetical protein [Pseudomonas]|uniref:Uncharacterized protein n=1 Tax=Pseudomonas putida TaxID=303 RepID=A0AAW6PWZ1_PSEPU|nr:MULTISPECIES: hypothetical protein [Pseudomonas]MCE0879749.1 hypothetical protein [Pseudomonas putida]MDF3873121.1 hypothetical protein [Pseudomonas putida]MDF3879416.1 hypothetical protein [Pseudomonas putida]MDH4842438.1 hypothetical protein [Pseudomonas sp. BN605]MDH4858173.1 hypothetical protein [Pseudomonas sp. BN505]
MRIRGDIFWKWADPALHHRTHYESLDDGTTMDVQVRLSRTGDTQMFIGVYAGTGMPLHEEAFDTRPGESMTRALAWGVGRARCLAAERHQPKQRIA